MIFYHFFSGSAAYICETDSEYSFFNVIEFGTHTTESSYVTLYVAQKDMYVCFSYSTNTSSFYYICSKYNPVIDTLLTKNNICVPYKKHINFDEDTNTILFPENTTIMWGDNTRTTNYYFKEDFEYTFDWQNTLYVFIYFDIINKTIIHNYFDYK